MKLKHLAAAVALIGAATGANAAMTNFASGNSSLAFIALDSVGSPISMVMDLGYTIDQFTTTAMASDAGKTIVWNFNTNTLTVDGNAVAGDYAWSNALTTFGGTAQTAETRWGVIAGDSLSDGTPGDVRYLSTSNTALSTIQTQTKANLTAFSVTKEVFDSNNLLSSHSTNTDGGSTATSGLAYVGNGLTFGTTGNWQAKATFNALANEGVAQKFYQLDSRNGTSSTRALVTQYKNSGFDSSFSYSAGVLTYNLAAVAAPIPEPETYGMLLAGLGMIGFMARRRLANRA